MGIEQKKIGIIGGGQLGKMMILAAKKMDFEVIILDPSIDCPAHSIANEHLVADFSDAEAIKELAEKSDVLTYEFEHINVSALKELAAAGHEIYPTAKSLEIIQNKFHQKQLLKAEGLAVPEFVRITDLNDLEKAVEGFGLPLMLKSCEGGYDGKGNFLIKAESELETAFEELDGDNRLLMAEEYIPFDKEVSVIVCRGIDGSNTVYPIGENIHRESILFETKVPAEIDKNLSNKAAQVGFKVADVFAAIGIFCIELFLADGKVLVNEIAPRPHNSGHYSIEGAKTSQFENHIRAITGLPLGDTELLTPIVMRNILGAKNKGPTLVKGLAEALEIRGVKVHIYGKSESYYQRKMGHLTATADNLAEAENKAKQAREQIEITGK